MKIVLFYHSLVSDWNHGNAHFLRGVATELKARGHQVEIYEPRDAWSRVNLVQEHGGAPVREFQMAYPGLRSHAYDLCTSDPEPVVQGADAVIVHEWNAHELVARIGKLREKHPFRLLFHDTHHRLVTEPEQMEAYDLSAYDGVLAFGNVLRDLYLERGLAKRAWTWHEAADTRVFRPKADEQKQGDLVWIGNWGDDERTEELHEFLIGPVRELGLKACVYGVRYPEHARRALEDAGIDYRGWLPNFHAPDVFGRFKVTVHVPRRPYVRALPGIPTIRPFEALACGIPLVSAPWNDAEGLFKADRDYLVARDGTEMAAHLRRLIESPAEREALAAQGLETIRRRHTCSHRVDELLAVIDEIPLPLTAPALI